MTKLPIYCLLSVTALSVNAGAKSDAMRQEQAACGELSSYSHIAGCHQLLLEKSDTLLNGEYKGLVSYLSGTDRKNLIDAQRKWVKFRDADCFFSDPREQDSSIASANRAACLADRTIERLKHVEDYSAPWNKGCNGCPW
jgi:uncharacterized protein YecT (DUF1311 family)